MKHKYSRLKVSVIAGTQEKILNEARLEMQNLGGKRERTEMDHIHPDPQHSGDTLVGLLGTVWGCLVPIQAMHFKYGPLPHV